MARINGKILREIREEKKLTLSQLAEKAGMDAGTIHRLEKGSRLGRSRGTTSKKLAVALQIDEAVLSGDAPKPLARHNPVVAKDQLNLRIDNAARNALVIVSRRYGVTQAQVVEIAPLLFFIAAEQSLQARRRVLSEIEDTKCKLEEIRNSVRHLPNEIVNWAQPYNPFEYDLVNIERRSIESNDVVGKIIQSEAPIQPSEEWNESEANPFWAFINNMLTRLPGAASFEGWSSEDAPIYEICLADVTELVGGDTDAAKAIVTGDAPLHEMPKEIRAGTPKSRAEWSRARADEVRKQADEARKQLQTLLELI